MQSNTLFRFHSGLLVTAVLLLTTPTLTKGQNVPSPSTGDSTPDLKSLAESVRLLQSQVQSLSSQVNELRSGQQQAVHEAAALRSELNRTKEQLAAREQPGAAHAGYGITSPPSEPAPTDSHVAVGIGAQQSGATLEEQVSKLEDDQRLMNDKIVEQSQTKVESGSKYRVRLSGIVLFNANVTRGSVDNLDFPQIATPPPESGVSGAFSGSLRQSQIGIEAFGPDIAGARTSANVKFDFAGGFPNAPNGTAFGIVRLRTGTIRLDWEHTSIVAGQDSLFFAPLTPTTLASLAIPALSYTGNLWSWTPQIRIEHRVTLSDNSSLLLQAGILDSLTGDVPQTYYRLPTVGEQSGQPAYAARIAWSRGEFGRELTIGLGGYYGRQNWGFGRNVDGWVGITDATIPLGNFFDLSGEFYRGRAAGGMGGGIGQSVLLSGVVTDPGTTIRGLDSIGGWVQLKFKPKANFEVNFAYGQDNPFANELRAFPATAYYYGGSSLSRNLSPFVNFIYRVRSDVLFSVEYRRLQTTTLDSNTNSANQIGTSIGYIF
jgi:outer membrane murein-binding lipoprotein Lpp